MMKSLHIKFVTNNPLRDKQSQPRKQSIKSTTDTRRVGQSVQDSVKAEASERYQLGKDFMTQNFLFSLAFCSVMTVLLFLSIYLIRKYKKQTHIMTKEMHEELPKSKAILKHLQRRLEIRRQRCHDTDQNNIMNRLSIFSLKSEDQATEEGVDELFCDEVEVCLNENKKNKSTLENGMTFEFIKNKNVAIAVTQSSFSNTASVEVITTAMNISDDISDDCNDYLEYNQNNMEREDEYIFDETSHNDTCITDYIRSNVGGTPDQTCRNQIQKRIPQLPIDDKRALLITSPLTTAF